MTEVNEWDHIMDANNLGIASGCFNNHKNYLKSYQLPQSAKPNCR